MVITYHDFAANIVNFLKFIFLQKNNTIQKKKKKHTWVILIRLTLKLLIIIRWAEPISRHVYSSHEYIFRFSFMSFSILNSTTWTQPPSLPINKSRAKGFFSPFTDDAHLLQTMDHLYKETIIIAKHMEFLSWFKIRYSHYHSIAFYGYCWTLLSAYISTLSLYHFFIRIIFFRKRFGIL